MAAEHPLESVPPQRRASGAEIAPLVDGADGAAQPTDEHAEKRASPTASQRPAHTALPPLRPAAFAVHPPPATADDETGCPTEPKRRVAPRRRPGSSEEREVAEAEELAWEWERGKTKCVDKTKWAAKLLSASVVVVLVVMIIVYFHSGCGACENDAACDGLFGECVCTGNHLGEYCEDSCGELGQVNGGACVCSGNRTGAFCELDMSGMILRSDYNDATVGAVTYMGATQDLTWQLQHELCNDAGKATPGSSARACPLLEGTDRVCASQKCSFSSNDDVVHDNHVVAGDCNGDNSTGARSQSRLPSTYGGWSGQVFRHVSGSLAGGVGYMCAGKNCNDRVRVEGTTVRGESSNERASLRDGDAVFCSTCQVTDGACCGINCGGGGQCSDGVCSCKEGADLGPGIWFGPSVCGGFCEEIDDEARSPIAIVLTDFFLLLLLGSLYTVGAMMGTICVGYFLDRISCGRIQECMFSSGRPRPWMGCLILCEAALIIVLTVLHVGCKSSPLI